MMAHAQNQHLLDSLKKVLATAPPDTNRVNILNDLAYEIRYTPGPSLKYCEEARALSGKLHFASGHATALNNTGNACYNGGKAAEALKWQLAALEEWKKLHNKPKIAGTYSQVGMAYVGLDNYTEALKYQLLALKLREEIGKKEDISMSYFNLAGVYYQLKRFDDVLDVAKKGLAIDRERGDMLGVAGWYSNMGVVERNMGKYHEALEHHLEALKIRKETVGQEHDLVGSYMNIGNVYEDLGDKPQALKYHLQSLELFEKMDDLEGTTGARLNVGRIYSGMGEHEKALKYIKTGLDTALAHNMRDYVYDAYDILAAAYANKKDFVHAYQYHKLYTEMKDSLLNETNSMQVAQMKTLYETEKKDKENEILKQQNQIQELEAAKKDAALGKQSLIIYSVTGGLLLSMLLGFFVYRGYREKKSANEVISLQKMEVEQQKEMLEERNKSITDSINYAKKIQHTILPSEKMLQRLLPEHFMLYLPKDIVSGDFYWVVSPKPGEVIIAIADCTGHGVPGALMSMIGVSLLNEIVTEKKITRPDLVLNQLRESVIKALSSEEGTEGRDGMDIVLCRFDMNKNILEFAAANNPLWIIDGESLIEYKGDKFPVGPHAGEIRLFTLHEMQLKKGMCVYAFSDGYADQFGGHSGKKFKYRQLQELIASIAGKPMEEQGKELQQVFESWKGALEQVDDVLVAGIRIS
jgi:serine phosphatase RsbU (regulator of sigma subunit)